MPGSLIWLWHCFLSWQGGLLRGGASRGEKDSEAGGHQVHPQEGSGGQREQHWKRDRRPAQVCCPNLHSKHARAHRLYVILPHSHLQHMHFDTGRRIKCIAEAQAKNNVWILPRQLPNSAIFFLSRKSAVYNYDNDAGRVKMPPVKTTGIMMHRKWLNRWSQIYF